MTLTSPAYICRTSLHETHPHGSGRCVWRCWHVRHRRPRRHSKKILSTCKYQSPILLWQHKANIMCQTTLSQIQGITYRCCDQSNHSDGNFSWHNPIVALMGWELVTEAVGKGHGSSCEKHVTNHIDDPDITIRSRAHWEEIVWIALRWRQTLVKFYSKVFSYIRSLRKRVVIFWELLFSQLLDPQNRWNGHELSVYNGHAAVLDIPAEEGNARARLNRMSTPLMI